MISIIIPVYHERTTLPQTLAHLRALKGYKEAEVVVVDGDNGSSIQGLIPDQNTHLLISPKGRAAQMNHGAKEAKGDRLLFLHADTRLPADGLAQINSCASPFGAFDLKIESPRSLFRLIEKISSWRSRLSGIPYGDQAIWIDRQLFGRIGGYQQVAIMEEVMLCQALKKAGYRPHIFKSAVTTSARRWEKEGIVYATLRNWGLLMLFFCGVSPDRLGRHYPTQQDLP